MCAVRDDFFRETLVITPAHLISLTQQVDKLCKAGLIHCDLRLSNILFLNDGVVKLIDFEWRGKYKEASFPYDVNIMAFGNFSSSFVVVGELIPSDFD